MNLMDRRKPILQYTAIWKFCPPLAGQRVHGAEGLVVDQELRCAS
jgi:hypothetical protein